VVSGGSIMLKDVIDLIRSFLFVGLASFFAYNICIYIDKYVINISAWIVPAVMLFLYSRIELAYLKEKRNDG
jgi:hypothetical protein